MNCVLRLDGLFMVVFLGGEILWELWFVFFEVESELEGGIFFCVSLFVDVCDMGGFF